MLVLNEFVSGGIKKYRMNDPHITLINQDKYNITLGGPKELNENTDDTLLVHFSIFQQVEYKKRINELRAEGKKIIIDIDDYWKVPPTHHLFKLNKATKMTEVLEEQFIAADGIICSTDNLFQELIKFNKNVIVIPNTLDFKRESKLRSYGETNRLNIGWAGGSSHLEDMKLMGRINILSKLPDARFILAGFDNRNINPDGTFNRVNDDRNVYVKYEKIITNNYNLLDNKYTSWLTTYDRTSTYPVKNQNYERRWSIDINKYLKSMADFDVFIVPLVYNEYNKYKSELKLLEASLHKIPVVCSDLPQYSNIIEKSSGGFTVEKSKAHKDFVKYLKILQDKSMRLEMGGLLHEYMSTNFELLD